MVRVPSAWDHFSSTRTVQTGCIMDVDAMDHGCGCDGSWMWLYSFCSSCLPCSCLHTHLHTTNQSINQSINRLCPGSYLQPLPALRGCCCPRTRLPLSGLLQPPASLVADRLPELPSLLFPPPAPPVRSGLRWYLCCLQIPLLVGNACSDPIIRPRRRPAHALGLSSPAQTPMPSQPSRARAPVPFCSMATSLWATCSLPGPVRSLF